MPQALTSSSTRQRLAYAAASLLVAWHTVAMVVAAAPENAITEALRRVYDPYLVLLRLDNKWGFFAPNVHRGYQFRYVVEDADGQRHTFIPGEGLSRLHPNSIWIRDWYKSVMESPDVFGDAAAAALCREHGSLRPVSITLLELEQKHFAPWQLETADPPAAPEYLNERTLKTIPCPTR